MLIIMNIKGEQFGIDDLCNVEIIQHPCGPRTAEREHLPFPLSLMLCKEASTLNYAVHSAHIAKFKWPIYNQRFNTQRCLVESCMM